MKKEEIELYEISDAVYSYYINTRENIGITRDVLCGEKYKTVMIGVEIVYYENLVICIENHQVIWMSNVKGEINYIKQKERRELNV